MTNTGFSRNSDFWTGRESALRNKGIRCSLLNPAYAPIKGSNIPRLGSMILTCAGLIVFVAWLFLSLMTNEAGYETFSAAKIPIGFGSIIYSLRRMGILAKKQDENAKEKEEKVNISNEGEYFFYNFSQIQDILSDKTISASEAIIRVMRHLTSMSECHLLQKGAFFLAAEDGQSLKMLVQYNADNLLDACRIVKKNQCLCGKVLANNAAIYKSCVDHDHSIHPKGMKPHGHYVIPVRWENEVLGVFTLYIEDGAPYSERTHLFLDMVAEAIAKRLIYERLQIAVQETRASYQAAANLLGTILPDPSNLERLLQSRTGLIYRPVQDIGGDFYFLFDKGEWVYFGIGDAEGHGIAGALLAVMLLNSLRESIEQCASEGPSKILKNLHAKVLRIFYGKEAIQTSGADIALCMYNRYKNELWYSGARLPLVYTQGEEMCILEASSAAIGSHQVDAMSFVDARLDVRPDTRLYLISDGLASQLGGGTSESTQKFGRRRLYQVLQETLAIPITEQVQKLETVIQSWRRYTDQTDDMTLWALEPEVLRHSF